MSDVDKYKLDIEDIRGYLGDIDSSVLEVRDLVVEELKSEVEFTKDAVGRLGDALIKVCNSLQDLIDASNKQTDKINELVGVLNRSPLVRAAPPVPPPQPSNTVPFRKPDKKPKPTTPPTDGGAA